MYLYVTVIYNIITGKKKKMSIIAALLHGPKILLLDEPTSAMDAVSVKAFKDIITGLKNSGTAILLTMHILEIAEKMCQRIAVIGRGRILAEGTLDDIKNAGKRPGRELEEAFLLITNPQDEGEGAAK